MGRDVIVWNRTPVAGVIRQEGGGQTYRFAGEQDIRPDLASGGKPTFADAPFGIRQEKTPEAAAQGGNVILGDLVATRFEITMSRGDAIEKGTPANGMAPWRIAA